MPPDQEIFVQAFADEVTSKHSAVATVFCAAYYSPCTSFCAPMRLSEKFLNDVVLHIFNVDLCLRHRDISWTETIPLVDSYMSMLLTPDLSDFLSDLLDAYSAGNCTDVISIFYEDLEYDFYPIPLNYSDNFARFTTRVLRVAAALKGVAEHADQRLLWNRACSCTRHYKNASTNAIAAQRFVMTAGVVLLTNCSFEKRAIFASFKHRHTRVSFACCIILLFLALFSSALALFLQQSTWFMFAVATIGMFIYGTCIDRLMIVGSNAAEARTLAEEGLFGSLHRYLVTESPIRNIFQSAVSTFCIPLL